MWTDLLLAVCAAAVLGLVIVDLIAAWRIVRPHALPADIVRHVRTYYATKARW